MSKIHPLLRSVSRKKLYKFLKEGWSHSGKEEIKRELARRKKRFDKRHGTSDQVHDQADS